MDYQCENCNFFKGIGKICEIGYYLPYTEYNCKDHSKKVSINIIKSELSKQMYFYKDNYDEIKSILKNETDIITLVKMKNKHINILWKINKDKK